MIIKLSTKIPLRFKSAIFSNTISRTKFILNGIQEDYYFGGFVLSNNSLWDKFYKRTYSKYINIGRVLVYKEEYNHIIGFDYLSNVKSWTLYEINILNTVIEDEIKKSEHIF